MTRFTRHDFLQLTAPVEGPCVSLYCPLERTGRTSPQDNIRMKNLLSGLKDRLSKVGMRAATARDLVQKVRSRLDELDLWTAPGQTAAVFFSPTHIRAYPYSPLHARVARGRQSLPCETALDRRAGN